MTTFIPTSDDIEVSKKIVKAMTTPVFDQVNATHDLYRATARLEARKELADELRKIQKPTKQVVDIIKRLETNAGDN